MQKPVFGNRPVILLSQAKLRRIIYQRVTLNINDADVWIWIEDVAQVDDEDWEVSSIEEIKKR